MKILKLILPALLLFALASLSFAADLNGKCKGDLKMQDGSNIEISFAFKVDGEKLTGTVTNTFGEEQITDGMVKGDDVSFVILAGGGQFRIVYKGKLSGEDLKFTVTVGDFGDQEMIAKRIA